MKTYNNQTFITALSLSAVASGSHSSGTGWSATGRIDSGYPELNIATGGNCLIGRGESPPLP